MWQEENKQEKNKAGRFRPVAGRPATGSDDLHVTREAATNLFNVLRWKVSRASTVKNVEEHLIRVNYSSNSAKCYLLTDPEAARDALAVVEQGGGEEDVPKDLFDHIVGYDEGHVFGDVAGQVLGCPQSGYDVHRHGHELIPRVGPKVEADEARQQLGRESFGLVAAGEDPGGHLLNLAHSLFEFRHDPAAHQ